MIFLLSKASREAVTDIWPPTEEAPWAFSLTVKWLGQEEDQALPSNGKVKNMCSCTCTLPCLLALLRENFMFTFYRHPPLETDFVSHSTVGSHFATVRFMMIHFYDPCPVGPSTPDLWCITVATQASFLYLVHF